MEATQAEINLLPLYTYLFLFKGSAPYSLKKTNAS